MPNNEDIHAKMSEAMKAVTVPPPPAKPPLIANVAASLAPAAYRPVSEALSVSDAFASDYAVAFAMAFIGAGQGGGKMAAAMWQLGYRRACAFNTTDMDFNGLPADMLKYALGVGGAGKDTSLAAAALRGREESIRDLLTRAWGPKVDCAMICASLGGGTGSGTAPQLVKIARQYLTDNGASVPRVGALVSLPAVTEGFQICRNAFNGFMELVKLKVSPLIIVDNNRIHALYRPSMAQLYPTANDTVAKLFHVFNQLAAVHSDLYTFDRSEFAQLLDSGLVTMGASNIQKFDSPADISEAIRLDLAGSVLAEVDIATGRKAACLFVAHNTVLERLDRSYFDAGFTQLDRMLGSAHGTEVSRVVHPGLYRGSSEGLQAYVLLGGMAFPAECLQKLAEKGGLSSQAAGSRMAEFLGVNDAGHG